MTASEAYAEKLRDPRWRDRRLQIIRRDGGRCARCGTVHGLQVHHFDYEPGREPWDYPDGLLTTLCDRCHKTAHVGPEPGQLRHVSEFLVAAITNLIPGGLCHE